MEKTNELKTGVHYITMYPTKTPTEYIKKQTETIKQKGYILQDYNNEARAKYNKAQNYQPISWSTAYNKTQYQLAINDIQIYIITDYYNDKVKKLIMTAMSNGTYTKLYIPKYKLEYTIKPLITKQKLATLKDKPQFPWHSYNNQLNPIQDELDILQTLEWEQQTNDWYINQSKQQAVDLINTIRPTFQGDTKEQKMEHLKTVVNTNKNFWDITIPETLEISVEIKTQHTYKKTQEVKYFDRPIKNIEYHYTQTDYDYTTAYTIAQYYIKHNLIEPSIESLREEQEQLTLLLFNPDNKTEILNNLTHYAKLYERLEELNFKLLEPVSYEELQYKIK